MSPNNFQVSLLDRIDLLKISFDIL